MMRRVAEEMNADEPLVAAIRSGDRYAFEEFVRRHERTIRGVIFGVLGKQECVEDVSQQVWTTVWQRIGELREVKSWRAWVCKLAHNLAIDAGRDLTRRRSRFQTVRDESLPVSAMKVGSGAADQGDAHVLDAIQGLPAIYRQPFVLRHLNDWSYQQIADVMGLPVDSVETRLVRARRLLREALADQRT